MTLPLEREALMPRIDGMRHNLERLRSLGRLPLADFRSGDNFDLAQHHLRLTLEGVFHIGAHVLSRLPSGRPVEYRDIAVKLGDLAVVPTLFAETKLVPMARLRNLLVHHYADIDPERLYVVVREHLTDVETFLGYVKALIEHPERLELTIT